MPHKFYHGRTGVVWNVTKRALGVEVNKEVGDRERKESGRARERTYKAATPTTPSLPSPLPRRSTAASSRSASTSASSTSSRRAARRSFCCAARPMTSARPPPKRPASPPPTSSAPLPGRATGLRLSARRRRSPPSRTTLSRTPRSEKGGMWRVWGCARRRRCLPCNRATCFCSRGEGRAQCGCAHFSPHSLARWGPRRPPPPRGSPAASPRRPPTGRVAAVAPSIWMSHAPPGAPAPAPGAAAGPSTSSTTTTTAAGEEEEGGAEGGRHARASAVDPPLSAAASTTLTLHLVPPRRKPRKAVRWSWDVVDNEGDGKKSSKSEAREAAGGRGGGGHGAPSPTPAHPLPRVLHLPPAAGVWGLVGFGHRPGVRVRERRAAQPAAAPSSPAAAARGARLREGRECLAAFVALVSMLAASRRAATPPPPKT